MEVALEEAIQSLGEPPQEVVSTEDVHVKTECFICQKAIDSVQDSFELLQCETETSKTKLVEKMGQIVDQADVVIVVAEADTICRQCFGLLNTIDKLEGGLEKLKEEVRVHIVPRYKVQVPKPEPEEVEIRSGKKRVKRESGRATRNSPAKKTKNIRVAIKTATAKGKGAKQTNEPSVTITEEEIVEEEEDHAVETSTTEDPQPGPSTSTESTNLCGSTHIKSRLYKALKLNKSGTWKVKIHPNVTEAGKKFLFLNPSDDDSIKHQTKRKRWKSVHKCDSCSEEFPTEAQLHKHEWSHLKSQGLDLCKECGKTLKTRAGFEVHHARHRGEYKYKCNVCNKGFFARESYAEHCTIHTGEKPHVCDKCGRTFRQASSLVVHSRLMHEQREKNYMCDICGKAYSVSSHLAQHKRVHLSKRPFTCQYCSKAFFRRDVLKDHVSKHTRKFLYHCQWCDVATNRRFRMQQHLNSAHSMPDPEAVDQCRRNDSDPPASSETNNANQLVEQYLTYETYSAPKYPTAKEEITIMSLLPESTLDSVNATVENFIDL